MKITPQPLKGVFLLELEPVADVRGTFARQFCHKELAAHGLPFAHVIYPLIRISILCVACIIKKPHGQKLKLFLV